MIERRMVDSQGPAPLERHRYEACGRWVLPRVGSAVRWWICYAILMHAAWATLRRPLADAGSGGFDPCVDREVALYLNRPDVQAALHVTDAAGAAPRRFRLCNPDIRFSECGSVSRRRLLAEHC